MGGSEVEGTEELWEGLGGIMADRGHSHSPDGRRFSHETQGGPGDSGLRPTPLLFLNSNSLPYFLLPTYSLSYLFKKVSIASSLDHFAFSTKMTSEKYKL